MRFGVTGASGQLGRLVTAGLTTAVDPGEVVLITRTPDSLNPQPGTTVRLGDFSRTETLDHAFAEIETLLLISTDTVGVRLEQQRAAIAAAARAGVKRILYTSVPNPIASNPAFVVPDHAGTEAALRESGMQWTALRNNLYAHMQVPGIRQAAASGRFVANQGDGRAAYVTREDCAAVAVAAMLQSGHENQAYDVTGPEALGAADLAALAGDHVEVVPVTDDEYVAGLIAANLPEPLARGLASFGAGIRDGHFAAVTNVVHDLAGRPAASLTSLLA
ncbi:MAG: NAD(P)H-binding protein [Streptosporangiaceae bacterium]|jgi:NAD(P)H dehydrogenase (quinone)